MQQTFINLIQSLFISFSVQRGIIFWEKKKTRFVGGFELWT
jgi:hypothetical protein